MLRYALYCRKSDKDDGDTIKSIDDQRTYWTERAAQLGFVIAKTYEENMSAMIPDMRPIWREMITDLQMGRVNAILVWHINRLARNVKEGGEFAQLLVDGIIQEVRTPNSCYTPADNILPLLLEQGSAVQQSRDLSRVVKLSLEQMAKAGGWPHQAHIGYLNARDPLNIKRGIVIPDADRFPLIRRGMEMMLTNLYSMRQVIDAMNSWGLRTRPTDNKPSKPLAYSRGYGLFADPFYAGFVRYHGQLYPGKHTPMLNPHEYARLQEILKFRMRTQVRRRQAFTYTGLLRCGLCGLQVTAELRRKRERHYIYYHCSDSRKRCNKQAITERALETTIREVLHGLIIDGEAAQVASESIRAWLGHGANTVIQTQAQQQVRLEAIDRERAALLDLVVEGTLQDKALYQRKDDALREERNQITIAVSKGQMDLNHISKQASALLSFASRAPVEFANAEPERKREIAAALGFRYELRNREIKVIVDTALEKIVHFARQKSRSLEPGNGGSGSQSTPTFKNKISFGWPQADPVEPDEGLMKLLQESSFPNLFVHSLNPDNVHS